MIPKRISLSVGRKCECQRKATLYPDMTSMYDREKELPFVNHLPGECRCKNEIREYTQNGEQIWLCSNCC